MRHKNLAHRPGYDIQDDALVPAIALVTAKLCLAHTMREIAGTYLGPATAGRVLAGEMRRGQSAVVPAAILLADLCALGPML